MIEHPVRLARTLLAGTLASLALAVPAHAASVALPDPSGLTLFALGVAGLLVGRRVARGKQRGDDDK